MKPTIHIVDDEANVRLAYRTALEIEGYAVLESNSAEEALAQFAKSPGDVAILDMRMPGTNGLELLAQMRARGIVTPTVMITAYGDVRHAVQAMKLGAIDFLAKPITPPQLREIVGELLKRASAATASPARKPNAASATEGIPVPLLLAKHAINTRDFEEARFLLKEAVAQGDRPAEAHNLLGMLQQILGEYEQAKASFERSLALDPHYEPARQNLQELASTTASENFATRITTK